MSFIHGYFRVIVSHILDYDYATPVAQIFEIIASLQLIGEFQVHGCGTDVKVGLQRSSLRLGAAKVETPTLFGRVYFKRGDKSSTRSIGWARFEFPSPFGNHGNGRQLRKYK